MKKNLKEEEELKKLKEEVKKQVKKLAELKEEEEAQNRTGHWVRWSTNGRMKNRATKEEMKTLNMWGRQ